MAAKQKGSVHFHRNARNRKHYWSVKSTNGQVIATSGGQGYSRLSDAKRSVSRTRAILNVNAL